MDVFTMNRPVTLKVRKQRNHEKVYLEQFGKYYKQYQA